MFQHIVTAWGIDRGYLCMFERTEYFHINNFILLTRSRAKQHQLLFYHIISVIYVLFVDENTQF